jgi:predicted acetylornithine/succinylornithine family transaminase
VNKEVISGQEIVRSGTSCLARVANRFSVVWERGEGSRLWDREGRKYLDFFSGHAVMNLGYAHPAQYPAMHTQMERMVHAGNLYYMEPQVELARRLVQATFGDRVLFANSGAEIVELAIKVARKWARQKGSTEDRFEILTMRGSFHGRTYGALSATGQEKHHQDIGPMLPGFKYAPLNNFVAAASAISNRTCAIMLEPIQGEGGIYPAEKKYLRKLSELCHRNNLLLIFDEVQCGLGRTGYLNAYEMTGVIPDVLLLGKPLGGGLPISALVTREDIAAVLKVGDHGSTFGGNPVAAAAGCGLLSELAKPGFLQGVKKTGAYLGGQLDALAKTCPQKIIGVRGAGMMWGMELKERGPEMVQRALEQGLVINCTAGNVLRFLPALTIGQAEVDEACKILKGILKELK